MKTKSKQFGLTLTEIIVVIAIIAMLVGLGVPAGRAFFNSFETEGGTKSVINGLLTSARTIAVKEQKYAGVRFQQANDTQYAIIIISETEIPYPQNLTDPDDPLNYTVPFVALEGQRLMNLGRKLGVAPADSIIDSSDICGNIIFSPQGQLVRKWIMMYVNPRLKDEIYNDTKPALFDEDTVPRLSNRAFGIYNVKDWENSGYSDEFFAELEPIYINRYTGMIINR